MGWVWIYKEWKEMAWLVFDLGLSWEDSWILSLLNEYFSNQTTLTPFICLISQP